MVARRPHTEYPELPGAGGAGQHGKVGHPRHRRGPDRRQQEGDLARSTSAERAPRTLFVTNDFPPRIGGAQSYYWGAIRTLDPSEVTILAPAHVDAAAFDATHPYTVVRASTSVLWPTAAMLRTVAGLAAKVGAELVQLGHPLPAGLLGPQLKDRCGLPYVVFLGGAEVTLPGAIPGVNNLLRHVLGKAAMLLTVSEYTARAASQQVRGRVPAEVLRPPLDVAGFVPATADEAQQLRRRLGIDGELVVCLGRLVPRKGQDKLIDALALLRGELPACIWRSSAKVASRRASTTAPSGSASASACISPAPSSIPPSPTGCAPPTSSPRRAARAGAASRWKASASSSPKLRSPACR